LQSKFQILTQKVELWSIKDIVVSVVDCCLLLYNWMVTVHLSRNETESTNEWYDVAGDGSEQNGDSGEQNGGRRENGDRRENGHVGT
jgi:hypothetical protein